VEYKNNKFVQERFLQARKGDIASVSTEGVPSLLAGFWLKMECMWKMMARLFAHNNSN